MLPMAWIESREERAQTSSLNLSEWILAGNKMKRGVVK
jgi:hypothetical protein